MKRVLVTAGSVYGILDDNKILSNRARGLWATKLAQRLAWQSGSFTVTLLLPDVMPYEPPAELTALTVVRHKGYHDYAAKCEALAPQHDAAVMAAAVLNFIPANPVKGKMSTAGLKEGDVINVPMTLAPRVINRMKAWNPNLTLIGCKLLSGAPHEELIDAAYHVVLDARCNAVVANDMSSLKVKHLVYQDRSVQTFDDYYEGFYHAVENLLVDEHFRTHVMNVRNWMADGEAKDPNFQEHVRRARETFDRLVGENRGRFTPRGDGRVFGAVAVRFDGPLAGWLVSPREKGSLFTADEGVVVHGASFTSRTVYASGKASLNAPLLIRVGEKFGKRAVLHFHEQVPGLPTEPYAPPGTVRDNDREIPGPAFNIEGHGCILAVE